MTLLVGVFVEAEWLLAVRLVGNDSLGAALVEPLPQRRAVISSIAKEFFGWLSTADKIFGGRAIMGLSATQKDGKKTAFSICDCMNFRIAPATRASNSLVLFPLFPPEAER